MNLEAVGGLPSRPVTGTWYRAIPPQHLPTALDYSRSRLSPSRYNAGPLARNLFDTVYLAEDPIVAQLEVGAMFGSSPNINDLVPNPHASYTILNAQVQLRNVLDLTDAARCQTLLRTNAQELTGDWRAYHRRNDTHSVPAPLGVAPTQELGAAIHECQQFAGFLAISAKFPYKMVLGVFPDRIPEGDFVRYSYTDAAGQKQIFNVP
jgi:RES domain-containing protein